MANTVGSLYRFGNPLTDPVTGQALAAPPGPFYTGGAATDPTAVTLTVDKPDGTVLTYGWPTPGITGTLTRESAGRFFADIPIDLDGTWRYRLIGTGTVAAAAEGSFWVPRSQVI